MGGFRSFTHKDARFRISSAAYRIACASIRDTRRELDAYIAAHPDFLTSLVPLAMDPQAPEIVRRMLHASRMAGQVGPMAAVAGAVAQMAAEAARAAGIPEVIIENGGDMFLDTRQEVQVGLFCGAQHPLSDRLALRVLPAQQPLAICSSSGRMGHSLSFGKANLATIMARDAALADALATQACNAVQTPEDIPRVLEEVAARPDVSGILLVCGDRLGLQGRQLPELLRNRDAGTRRKITVHARHQP